ncbi:unnamed protein product [Ilex paraguariensis]|uniref:Uncharacterized protein n=1 Tax=Ilex paraguariensis TaxID=185542 RepID=A0ABC8T9Y8_9AQUA
MENQRENEIETESENEKEKEEGHENKVEEEAENEKYEEEGGGSFRMNSNGQGSNFQLLEQLQPAQQKATVSHFAEPVQKFWLQRALHFARYSASSHSHSSILASKLLSRQSSLPQF